MSEDRETAARRNHTRDDGAPSGGAGGAASTAPRYRGWYWLGVVLQVLVWAFIWLGIAIAIGVGGELTEFRYVGF